MVKEQAKLLLDPYLFRVRIVAKTRHRRSHSLHPLFSIHGAHALSAAKVSARPKNHSPEATTIPITRNASPMSPQLGPASPIMPCLNMVTTVAIGLRGNSQPYLPVLGSG